MLPLYLDDECGGRGQQAFHHPLIILIPSSPMGCRQKKVSNIKDRLGLARARDPVHSVGLRSPASLIPWPLCCKPRVVSENRSLGRAARGDGGWGLRCWAEGSCQEGVCGAARLQLRALRLQGGCGRYGVMLLLLQYSPFPPFFAFASIRQSSTEPQLQGGRRASS